MNGFRILLIVLCLVPIAIMHLTGIGCICILQNFVWGFRTELFSLMRNAQASVADLETKKNHKLTAFPPHKKSLCVCISWKRKSCFLQVYSQVKWWETDCAGKHLLCFTCSIMRFGQPMEVTSDPMGILPCSMLHCISSRFPPVLVIFYTLWQVSQSLRRVPITVPQLPSSTGCWLQTQTMLIMFPWKQQAISLT